MPGFREGDTLAKWAHGAQHAAGSVPQLHARPSVLGGGEDQTQFLLES